MWCSLIDCVFIVELFNNALIVSGKPPAWNAVVSHMEASLPSLCVQPHQELSYFKCFSWNYWALTRFNTNKHDCDQKSKYKGLKYSNYLKSQHQSSKSAVINVRSTQNYHQVSICTGLMTAALEHDWVHLLRFEGTCSLFEYYFMLQSVLMDSFHSTTGVFYW